MKYPLRWNTRTFYSMRRCTIFNKFNNSLLSLFQVLTVRVNWERVKYVQGRGGGEGLIETGRVWKQQGRAFGNILHPPLRACEDLDLAFFSTTLYELEQCK